MKYLYYTIFIIAILFLFMFVGEVLGEETLSGKLIVDFPKEEAVYVESHEWPDEPGTVRTSVRVESNACNTCLRDRQPSSCLIECDQVIMIY